MDDTLGLRAFCQVGQLDLDFKVTKKNGANGSCFVDGCEPSKLYLSSSNWITAVR